jgi:O-antigen ligase
MKPDLINNDYINLALSGDEPKKGIWPRSFPLWMTSLYMALFIIRPWEQLFPWLSVIHFERVYAIIMIGVIFFGGKFYFKITFQSITVILFLSALGVSALFAWEPSLSLDPLYEYITLMTFYFILLSVIRKPYDLFFIIISYIFIMAVYLAKSQWEFFINQQHRYDMGVVRMVGIENTFGGPNNLAMSIVVSLPFALFLWSYRKEISIQWPVFWKKWFSRFMVLYFILAVSSIILTNSRSGMISFVFFIVLATFKGRGIGRRMGYILLGILLLGFLWMIIPDQQKNRFSTIWDPGAGPETAQISAEGRIEGYKAGMIMFDRFPITGVGIGNFLQYRVKNVDEVPLNAHNLAGQLLGETGMIGGMAFSLMLLALFMNTWKVNGIAKKRFKSNQSIFSGLSAGIRGALLLLIFEGFFGHNLMRFNWLWLAAFSSVNLEFLKNISSRKNINLRGGK